MVEVLKTSEFDAWLSDLKDRQAVARITARIDRLALGNPGDVKPVGAGVSEMRIDYGPGYRIYYSSEAHSWCCSCAAAPASAFIEQSKQE